MLIGGDDVSNDINNLGTWFSMFFLHSRSFPLRADWLKPDSSVDAGSHMGIGGGDSNSRDKFAS